MEGAIPALIDPQARMRASRLKAGTSLEPESSGANIMATGPSLVRYRAWHAGRVQVFLVTPARRSVSAR